MDPLNPNLVVNYRRLHDTEVVVLCDPGAEVQWETGLDLERGGYDDYGEGEGGGGQKRGDAESIWDSSAALVHTVTGPERPRSRRNHK